MLTRRPAAIAVLLVLSLVTAACGSRLSDAQREKAIASYEGGGSGGGSGGSTGGGSTGGTTSADTSSGGTTGGTSTGGTATGGTSTGGSTGGTSGGTGGGALAGGQGQTNVAYLGGGCSPGKATSTGVTPTELKVGNVSQLTGLVPGFGQTGVNGVKAYFNYINSLGGICGRKVTLVQSDDRFQSATNRSETQKLAGQVIGFAGSVTVVDDGGAPVIDQAGVADVSLATTVAREQAKNNFSPNPIDPTPGSGSGQAKALAWFKANYGVSKAAIFYQDVAVGVNQSNNYKIDFQKAGIPVVQTYPVPPTATDFRSQALDMKQKGIDLVITVAEINAISNLARSFGQIGWFPKVADYGAQTYGRKFPQLAGANAEGAFSSLIFHIPEEGGPAATVMKTWYDRTFPGADLDFFALFGWVAGEMLSRAIRDAGPDPTQAKVVAALRTYSAYQSAYETVVNPAGKKAPSCFEVVTVKGGKWQKIAPTGPGFVC
jgi:ABC-type branched-subunit amino acid transport system substrate-binding protein